MKHSNWSKATYSIGRLNRTSFSTTTVFLIHFAPIQLDMVCALRYDKTDISPQALYDTYQRLTV